MTDHDYSGYFSQQRNPAPSAASTSAPVTRPESYIDGTGHDPFATPRTHNPFASPEASRPVSIDGFSAVRNEFDDRSQRFFHSRRVRKADIEKPWQGHRDPREKWVTILPLIGIFIGLAISGFLVWDGIHSVVMHHYCLALQDDFSQGLDTNTWTHEIQVGGFGNGEFEQTTDSTDNVYVDENNHLIIKATLQDESLIDQDSLIDLSPTGTDTCTSTDPSACIAVTNTTAGNSSIVPPILSGRLITKNKVNLKYGRVEVTAKFPVGDWLWPAIWMMPVDDTYGAWPASGEIDIAESRGNNHTFAQGGNNIASSALHWGPVPANDAYWLTNNKRPSLHSTYSRGFNTFGVEWSQKYLFTYINSRLLQVMYTSFDEPMWKRGRFPVTNANGTRLEDIWSQTGRKNTPFDMPFYLILNVAVGGTNGWFQDGKSGKPWLDGSPNARKDFWNARDQWFPTWTQPQMEVKKVVMWQQCDGNEEL